MLEELEVENDLNRKKVIEYLKESKFDLNKYLIKEFKDFPGGIELIDEKGRSIVFFYNYLKEEIEIIYKELKKDALGVYLTVVMFLVDKYKERAVELERLIMVDDIDKYHVRFTTKSKKGDNIIKISPIFDINNNLYNMYEYLENQIEELNKE